jgi:hypothetical protein
MADFFQRPHQLWEAPTFTFLTSQFGIYKRLLMVTLVPYQKSWNIKAHSYDILGAGMLWKPKEARILMNFIDQPVNIR